MLRIGFQKCWNRAGIEVYAMEYTPTGRIPIRITVEKLPEVSETSGQEPALFLRHHEAPAIVKALLDGLQEAGLMPPMNATEAELKSTMRHLADMRALAFESVKPAPALSS